MRTVSIIVAGMLTVAASVGSGMAATPWYLVNGSTLACMNASAQGSAFVSPGAAKSWLRQDGDYKSTEINRNSDGSISSVFVISQKNMVLVYFPNRGSCEEAIVMGLENGTLNNPKELR